MSLFRAELRKLLLNKKTLLLLSCLLILYSVVGLTSTMFLIGGNDSYRAYEELAAAWEGPFDREKAAGAEKIYQEVSARYGTDARMIARSVKDQPEIILAVDYHAYTGQVEEYWNGTPPESVEAPYGIALLQGRIRALKSPRDNRIPLPAGSFPPPCNGWKSWGSRSLCAPCCGKTCLTTGESI